MRFCKDRQNIWIFWFDFAIDEISHQNQEDTMSHECQDSCCGSHHHHHHHDHCHEDECCGHCECDEHHHHHHEKFSHQLLELADEAWMEVLKEEIANEIRRTSGDHLKKMAKLVNETNHERWKELMAEKKGLGEFEEKLKSLLYGAGKK